MGYVRQTSASSERPKRTPPILRNQSASPNARRRESPKRPRRWPSAAYAFCRVVGWVQRGKVVIRPGPTAARNPSGLRPSDGLRAAEISVLVGNGAHFTHPTKSIGILQTQDPVKAPKGRPRGRPGARPVRSFTTHPSRKGTPSKPSSPADVRFQLAEPGVAVGRGARGVDAPEGI